MDKEQTPYEEGAQKKPPYGFYLVAIAIVVVAIMYAVTIFAIGSENRMPEVVFGAMAASFTVIGTLVGTYFGLKAGLDGQDKVKETLKMAPGRSEYRTPPRAQRNGEQSRERQLPDGAREPRVRQRGDRDDDREGWEGGGV